MKEESYLMGENAMEVLVRRCWGSMYNQQIDSRLKNYSQNSVFRFIKDITEYKHITEIPVRERKKDNFERGRSEEPVVSLYYKSL